MEQLHDEETNDTTYVLFNRYSSGDQIGKNEMTGAYTAYGGRGGGVHKVLVGKPEEKKQHGGPSCRWENNIKMGH